MGAKKVLFVFVVFFTFSFVSAGTVSNSFATGNVTGTGNEGGLVGYLDGGRILNSYWYNHVGNPGWCYSGGDKNCTIKTDLNYFKGDVYPNNAPLSVWGFFGIWQERVGNFPSLTWQGLGTSIVPATPDAPSSSSGGGGGGAGSNSCSSGDMQCSGDYSQTCDDHDGDGYTEWPSSNPGTGSQYCAYGCFEGECNSAPECIVDADCSNDGNVCTLNSCVGGTCTINYVSRSCSDGDSCTESDVCVQGSCKGEIVSCQPGYACELGICEIGGVPESNASTIEEPEELETEEISTPTVTRSSGSSSSGGGGGSSSQICEEDYRCGNWESCKTDAKLSDILIGGSIEGTQQRTCTDLNECSSSFVETRICETEIQVYSVSVDYCNVSYLEVYSFEDNVLLSRIKDSRDSNDDRSVDVILSLGIIEDVACEIVEEEDIVYLRTFAQDFLANANMRNLWRVFLR